ncbi:MAG: GerMN domain-containing protein [Candidatus Vogelbacteria bacterium]|nr:GerMN domain-containing protein [Candidatus Vogelbacteria bacterium]
MLRRSAPAETETSADGAVATTTVSVDELIVEKDNLTASVVNVADADTITLRVYFGNRRFDPQGLKCATVYPVSRTLPATTAVGRAALLELLKGPTPVEAAAGAVTSINPGVRLQNLTILNGVAYADFSSALAAEVGGACLVTAIRAQITETLKQFPTVKSVLISINGVSVGILQP